MNKQNYSLEEIEEIVRIDRDAGRLLKEQDIDLYISKSEVNLEIYNQFISILNKAKKFPKVFLDFDENYEGKTLTSKRISLCKMIFDGVENGLRTGPLTFDYPLVSDCESVF